MNQPSGGAFKQRIAVTGANGFLGYNLVRHLQAEGRTVRAIVRRSRPELDALGVDVRITDLTLPRALTQHVVDVDAVVHVAGTFAMHGRWRDTMISANVRTTEALLEAADDAGVGRFVLCSSSVTIGFGPREAPGNEDTPLDPGVYGQGPLRAYHDTKKEAEALTKARAGVVVNPDFVVGPWDFTPTSGGLLLLLARGRLPFYPRGGKCFQGVGDCVRGMVAAVDRGEPGRRYFLGGENLSYRDFLAIAARALGRTPPRWPLPRRLLALGATLLEPAGILPSPDVVEAMALERYRDGTRARTELGVPTTPIDKAIAEAVAWLQNAFGIEPRSPPSWY